MDIYISNINSINNSQTLEQNYPSNYNNFLKKSFPSDFFEESKLYETNHSNIFISSAINNNLGSLKLYNNNFTNKNSIKRNQSNDMKKLDFKFIESTTEDAEYPLMELKKGLKGKGWQSLKFSQFPQDIYIKFSQPVFIRRIDIITHEKYIPSQIKFYSYCPKDNEGIIKNYHQANYKYVGFIIMDTNERNDYKIRESRKIFINVKSLYFKIKIDKNHVNKYNKFNQVGLMSIDFMGEYLTSLGVKSRSNYLIIENSRNNLKLLDENQIAYNKFSTKDILDLNNKINNINLWHNINNDALNDIINESINDSLMSQFEQSNNNNISLFNKNNNKLNSLNNSKSHKSNSKDNILNYDDNIIPTVLKKLNNEPEKEMDQLEHEENSELDPISSPELLKEFYIITRVIKEEGMRKVFSKKIKLKEEGLCILNSNLHKILEYKDEYNSRIIYYIIEQIIKLCMILIEDKHPIIIRRTFYLLEKMVEYIKQHNIKSYIDSSITYSILFIIKQKLGDANPFVRDKAVSLYCYMLTLNFFKFDNLISELLEEGQNRYDCIYIPKPNNLVMSKLNIFENVFDNFSDTLKSKRTTLETFPSDLVLDYLIMNISHKNSEIRKIARLIICQFLQFFGVPKFEKKLEKIEIKELKKLIPEIPELRELYIKLLSRSKSELNLNLNYDEIDMNSNNKKGRQNSKSNLIINNYNYTDIGKKNSFKNNNNNLEDTSNKNIKKYRYTGFCGYCQRMMEDGEVLANHLVSNCKMFIQCEKCNKNLEVQKLNEHKEKECKFKNQFKLCNTCNECFLKEDFNRHQEEKCSLKNGSKKCPLCHIDIDISDKNAFFIHLVKEGCPKQTRK